MAGETAVVCDVPQLERDAPRPIATTWPLFRWLVAATVATGGLTWAVLTRPFALSGFVVYAFSAMYGAPLFVLTWVWLAGAIGFHHRPFVALCALWLVVLVPPIGRALTRNNPVTLVVFAGLPVAWCVAVLALTLRVRARQAKYFEFQSPAS